MNEPMAELSKLAQDAQRDGWAFAEGRIDQLRAQASRLNWELIPSRKGAPKVDVLNPVSREDAPKRSLSAKYGLGAQPLHTDGAHHVDPPDIVLLSADSPSGVPTRLWRLGNTDLATETWHDLRHGLFTVRSGNYAFLAPAFDRDRFRFDPGCMTPADPRSYRVTEFFRTVQHEAVAVEWSTSNMVLAIDNRRVLHARGPAEEEPARTIHRIAIRVPVEGK